MTLDIHTHHQDRVRAVVSVTPHDFPGVPGQLYSVGIHPWDIPEDLEESLALLRQLATIPEVVAIGEAGLDLLKLQQSPMFRQLQAFRGQIEISEELGKPLIIHDVRAHQEILQLLREYKPSMPWALHGFTAKPTVAAMFMPWNVYFSFGERFNSETLRSVPAERILAETDESPKSIEEIIQALSLARGEDLTETIRENTRRFLTHR